MNTIHFCHQETCKYKEILRTKSFFREKLHLQMTPHPYGFSVFTGNTPYFCKVDIAKSTTKLLSPPFY